MKSDKKPMVGSLSNYNSDQLQEPDLDRKAVDLAVENIDLSTENGKLKNLALAQ